MSLYLAHMLTAAALAGDVSGHVGTVVPVAGAGTESSWTAADNFTVGIPIGIGFGVSERVTVDFETVAFIDPDTRDMDLLIHPGAVLGLGRGYGVGGRFAVHQEGRAWGVTALANKGFAISDAAVWFVEAVVPLRVVDGQGGSAGYMAAFAVHTGFGF